MLRKIKIFFIKVLLFIILVCLLVALGAVTINGKVKSSTKDDIVHIVTNENGIPYTSAGRVQDFDADCVIVLGAGLKDSETPSDMLCDRLDVGIELYKKGLVPKILLSGDNGTIQHNELHAMLNYVLKKGVPKEDVFCDHAGFSTYDSMYRAKSIFKVKRAVVVTQLYHEYRALYVGEQLGIEVCGVASEQKSYMGETLREGREFLGRVKDFFKVWLRIKPALGGEEIPITGDGTVSHGE